MMGPCVIWNLVKVHPLGFWTGLSEAVEQLEKREPGLIPNLRSGSEIVVASDYAGEKLAYRAISFLLLNVPGNEEWDRRRKLFRSEHLPDGREISYKGL